MVICFRKDSLCGILSVHQSSTRHMEMKNKMTTEKHTETFCPVGTAIQLIGSKWKLMIIRNLMVRPWRFNELRKNLTGISQKVLTDSLRSMEEDGLITRTVYPEVPPRVEYSLTGLGEAIRPVLDAMEQWGSTYLNAAGKKERHCQKSK